MLKYLQTAQEINTIFHAIQIPDMVRQYVVSGGDENKIQNKR